MHLKLLFLLMIFKLTSARFTYTVPKFYSQENAVVKHGYRPMQMYPMYHIIPPAARARYYNPVITTTTTTSTTPPPQTTAPSAPRPFNDSLEEFPRDLLEIAKTKLGLRNLDEIPSISELGELLGTKSAAETIKYVRQLTSTEEGVALMKAYIESSDYTNSGDAGGAAKKSNTNGKESNENVGEKTDDTDENEDDEDEDEIDSDEKQIDYVSRTTTAKPKSGFLERMKYYLNIYNLLPEQEQKQKMKASAVSMPTTAPQPIKKPLVPFPVQRPPLPYHYPIPIRPAALQNQQQKSIGAAPPHLNTPNMKALRMHIGTLSKILKIPPMELEAFLGQKPKLMQLVHKLGSIPLNRDDGWAAIDGELWASAKRVLEQDEDMRKILNGPR